MDSVRLVAIGLVGLVLLAGAALAAGVVPLTRGQNSARPPCDQLQEKREVLDAVAARADMVQRIEDVGPGVTLSVVTPCEDYPDNAIVRVTFSSQAERDGVRAILNEDVLGAAVELVRN